MFPTLGLFASVRCPELSASNPGGSCKRNPCLFSHTAPPPRAFTIASTSKATPRAATSNKRGNIDEDGSPRTASVSRSGADEGDTGRPSKLQKVSTASKALPAPSLFKRDDDQKIKLVAPSTNSGASTSTTTTPAPHVGTSRIGAPRANGIARPSLEVTRTGKVIRKGPAPALQAQERPPSPVTLQSNASSALKGKGRTNGHDSDSVQVRSPLNSSSSISNLGPPRLPMNIPASYFPVATRNAMMKNIYHEFIRLYENFGGKDRHALASEHTLAQEGLIYSKNNKFSYRTATIAIIARLKKRSPAEGVEETGTMEDYDKYLKDQADAEKTRLTVQKAQKLTMDREVMIAHDYVVDVPAEPGGSMPTEEGGFKKCERCAADYIVHGNMSDAEKVACIHHWGRLEKLADRSRRWICCQTSIDAPGCTRGPHVFLEKSASDLHKRVAFVETKSLRLPEECTPLKIAALDCELIYTTAGMSLARLTIVDGEGVQKFDEFIRPNGLPVDLVTRWSGVTDEDIEERARMDFAKLRRDVMGRFIDSNTSGSRLCKIPDDLAEYPLTVLIGHGLENDLKAIRLVHPPNRAIDTAQLFPHPRGLPFRRALRMLVQEHLGKFIQDGGSAGHSSLVDARAALDLVKYKALKLQEQGQLG